MKKIILFTFLTIQISFTIQAQSIRKNYQEMTQSERDNLVSAFYQLRNGTDLVDDLAIFHSNNFSSIHFKLPSNPQNDVFLAWHRRQAFELEQAMQDINSNISIPFWDWTTDNSVTSSLWNHDFLGQFNSDWSLNRNLGGGQLPSIADVNSVQSITDWLSYSNTLEGGIVHTGPHGWVGGTMNRTASPRDPIFYLHHGMLDKLWQDWVEANNVTSSSDLYQITSLPRYDGTYVFDGLTLPLVNPDDIVDSKTLGVFFAEDKLAELENYTVSNTYRNQENFYYQYTIEAKDNFIVPSGKNAKLESVKELVLKPGFHAQNGSLFLAKIDMDNNINTNGRLISGHIERNQKPWKEIDIINNAYERNIPINQMKFTLWPNPVEDKLTLAFHNLCVQCEVEVLNLEGMNILKRRLHNKNEIELDLKGFSPGIYFIKVERNNQLIGIKKVIKR